MPTCATAALRSAAHTSRCSSRASLPDTLPLWPRPSRRRWRPRCRDLTATVPPHRELRLLCPAAMSGHESAVQPTRSDSFDLTQSSAPVPLQPWTSRRRWRPSCRRCPWSTKSTMRGWRRGEAWCRYSKGDLSRVHVRHTYAMHGEPLHCSLEEVLVQHTLAPPLGPCVPC